MKRMNWQLAAAGLGIIALIVVLAVWRSGGSSVVVAGDDDCCDTPAPADAVDQDADPTPGPAGETSDNRPSTAVPSAGNDAAGNDSGSADNENEGADSGSADNDNESSASGDQAGAGADQNINGDMRCILYLHGAGTGPGVLFDEVWAEDLLYLTPHSGNNEFPFFWLYDGPHNFANDPNDANEPFNQIVASLSSYLDANDCGPVMMHGESNGGGLAARIYCSGEDFGGRLWMALIDDPVPDAGVIGCSPSASVQQSLFVHSTEVVTVAESFVDNRCSISDEVEYPWYCMDDIGFDLAEYEAHIGQESVLGRPEHIGVNDDSVNFWMNVHQWWESLDPAAYARHVG